MIETKFMVLVGDQFVAAASATVARLLATRQNGTAYESVSEAGATRWLRLSGKVVAANA